MARQKLLSDKDSTRLTIFCTKDIAESLKNAAIKYKTTVSNVLLDLILSKKAFHEDEIAEGKELMRRYGPPLIRMGQERRRELMQQKIDSIDWGI